MKITYKGGKKDGQTVEIDDAQAKGLIEDGFAVAVADEADSVTVIEKALDLRDESLRNEFKAEMVKLAKAAGKTRPSIVVGPENWESDPASGFKSHADFLKEVVKYGKRQETSAHFNAYLKSTTGNTEGAAPDAGPTVPVQYTSEIFQMTGGLPNFWQYLFTLPVSTSSVKIPVLKNYNRSNSTVTAGVVAAVISEASNITQSKTNWEQLSISLSKEAIMVPVSNELMEDNLVSLPSVVGRQAEYQLRKAVNRGILQGSSAFTALIGHASAKDTTTTTTLASGTIASFKDVLTMYSNFAHDDADYGNAVWFVHPTVLPALGNMTSGNFNIYFPPGGAQDGSIGKLLGRPLIVTGQCNAANTSGDIVLADMSKYVGIYRGGVNAMVSPHVFFLTDEQAFRYTLRVGGKPGLSGAITLEDGSTTVSPFVTLATRT